MGRGRVIAMGDHMPVHLGSMPMSVRAAIAAIDFAPGDIAILNDPYAGGTHLPDITMVLPVFLPGVRGRHFMLPIARITRMLAVSFRDRWGRRTRFIRRGSGFLR